ncbi:hypothetical protein [Candidatus Nucleicultrix amoebiphila]|uniref:Uncharacterized protein n=1 Tax=Candidatus Nucleicultrix amoebiphila FS5 TaxID=1414854 RepID=A0A1W6N318_9PROT|nr:hypothetical protein [Candidatus Nucleicultrix amoebiphila]ARN84141.1 hypothetical protein GQ61_00930 [Candidatus Nucleicultrix amoebiphila FS5]
MLNFTLSSKKTTKAVIYTSIAALLATSMPVHASRNQKSEDWSYTDYGQRELRYGRAYQSGHWQKLKKTVTQAVSTIVTAPVQEVVEAVTAPRENVEYNRSSSSPLALEYNRDRSPVRPSSSKALVATKKQSHDFDLSDDFASRNRSTLKMVGYVMYAALFIGLIYMIYSYMFGGSDDRSSGTAGYLPSGSDSSNPILQIADKVIEETVKTVQKVSTDLMTHPDHPGVRDVPTYYGSMRDGHADITGIEIEGRETGILDFFQNFFAKKQ